MPDTQLDCELEAPYLTNWSNNKCYNIKQYPSAIEALATYICENIPEGGEAFITLSDTPPSYAGAAGQVVTVNGTEDGLEFTTVSSSDELVKVSANDTTAGYLLAKLAQGNGITLAEVNDGGDEDVSITVNEAQLSLGNLGARSHTSLTDIGTNTHAQIDTHIASTANPHTTTLEQARTANDTMTGRVNITVASTSTRALLLKTTDNITNSPLFATRASNDVDTFSISARGTVSISPSASTGTQFPSLSITSAAHTALTAGTERNEVHWNFSATQQFATGAIATQRAIRIQAPTYSFVGASTITDAVTLDIGGGPIAGTNATITNTYALRVGGQSVFNGACIFNVTSFFNNVLAINDVNVQLSSITGTKIGTATTQKLGFWNAAPVVQNTGWGSITNVTPDKAYDADTVTTPELADVVGTLIATLVSYGILGA